MFQINAENCERMACLGVENKAQAQSVEYGLNIIIQRSNQLLMKSPKDAGRLETPRSHSSCSSRKSLQPGRSTSLSLPVITIDHENTTEDRKLSKGSTEHLCHSKKSSINIRRRSNESLSQTNYLRVEECVLIKSDVANRPSSAKSESYCMVNNRSPDTRRHSMPAIQIEHQGADNITNGGSLRGHDMSYFYCLWNRPKSPRLLGRGALDVPKALKRQGLYRDCGCLTREVHQHFDYCKRR